MNNEKCPDRGHTPCKCCGGCVQCGEAEIYHREDREPGLWMTGGEVERYEH